MPRLPHNGRPPWPPSHMLANLSGLDRAIAWAGSANKLAALLGVAHQTVLTWRTYGVPAERVIDLEAKTGIPRAAIRPDLYRRGGDPPQSRPRENP